MIIRTSRISRLIPVSQFSRPRTYHDDATFGYRVPVKYTLPDYTRKELDNRNVNAPLLRYVESVRRHGHRAANVDPLGLMERDPVSALDPFRYGLKNDTKYPLNGILHVPPHIPPSSTAANPPDPPPREETGEGTPVSLDLDAIRQHLIETYVDKIGYEYMHCPNKDERLWFSHHVETGSSSFSSPMDAERRKKIWKLLARSEELDRFLGKKFPNLKRYGCEGAESMLPALDSLFELSGNAGVESIVLALPHRGRLSLLCDPDLLGYSPTALFAKIKGKPEFDSTTAPGATGDVISHLAATRAIPYGDKSVKVEILQNPSHLEAVNPVALGVTRAKQMHLLKTTPSTCTLGEKVLCVQLHGDAAFSGQGIVSESLSLSALPHYGCGGTIHIIVNNNIGYTTPSTLARSSIYASDIGKMVGCPILHVNGDYPEDVVRAIDVAVKYRSMFRKDIILDLICYRRWGHNELDEPGFTQPKMYGVVRGRKSVAEGYEGKLMKEGVIGESEVGEWREGYGMWLSGCLDGVDGFKPKSEMLEGKWKGMVWPSGNNAVHKPETGVDVGLLKEIAEASVTLPESFNVHPRLKRHISSRLKSLDGKVDFATAEAMAFGSLLQEGYDVRISGQDVGRGTFSQRHAMFVDQVDEGCIIPLNEAKTSKGRLELANSSLSEMAVLGFEVGMSWASPKLLPIWEAQFGDFMNSAQSMIDTFVVGAQAKWLKQSGLVMMLPHGYDGAGPEHSSCKIERFLQLSNDSPRGVLVGDVNLHVANPSTPAQLFHLLRRQMLRNYRKPLIIASPKGLLRSPVAASPLSDMQPGTSFQAIIKPEGDPGQIERLIFCSGKHYYTLLDALNSHSKKENIALVRIEELSPFPSYELAHLLSEYTNVDTLVWAQEEPENQGAWPFVKGILTDLAHGLEEYLPIKYAGRESMSTVATGVGEWHKKEVEGIIRSALGD